ncbi:MAG: glycosyltransferase family 2 protein [Armatimonadota bacterium]
MDSVTVIICTYNRSSSLELTLQSLARIHVPSGCELEIIVVDNRSTDDTKQVVDDARRINQRLRYEYEAVPGQSAARNAGLSAARGEIIAFTDDDLRFAPDWLEELIRPLRSDSQAVVGGITIAEHLRRDWMTPWHWSLYAGNNASMEMEGRCLTGANMAFLREVLKVVPGFDVELGPGRLGFCDDTLFSLQLEKAGYKIAYHPPAAVDHHFDPSRLSRVSLVDTARKVGSSTMYIDYHWRHQAIPMAQVKLLRKQLLLSLWRRRNKSTVQKEEGITEKEYWQIWDCGRLRQYMTAERHRPWLYDKFGSVKIAV